MKSFFERHRESIAGVIGVFDRLIFKGHLNGFYPEGAFGRYVSRCGILLKGAGGFFEAQPARLRDHVTALAATAGRPLAYLAQAHTYASGSSKEDLARQIAARDGVTEGLARQLDALGIGYRRSGNKITAVDDLTRAMDLCRQFAGTDWPCFLER
jgi:hypothetical protein